MLVESPADILAALGLCDPPRDPKPRKRTRDEELRRGGSRWRVATSMRTGAGARKEIEPRMLKDLSAGIPRAPPPQGPPPHLPALQNPACSPSWATIPHRSTCWSRTGLWGAVVQAAVLALELDGRIE
jgi:hypothetical protein